MNKYIGFITLHWSDGFCQSFEFGSPNFRGIKHLGQRPTSLTNNISVANLTQLELQAVDDYLNAAKASLALGVSL